MKIDIGIASKDRKWIGDGLARLLADGNDQTSANLATTRMQAHEKTAWMLRSQLQPTGSGR